MGKLAGPTIRKIQLIQTVLLQTLQNNERINMSKRRSRVSIYGISTFVMPTLAPLCLMRKYYCPLARDIWFKKNRTMKMILEVLLSTVLHEDQILDRAFFFLIASLHNLHFKGSWWFDAPGVGCSRRHVSLGLGIAKKFPDSNVKDYLWITTTTNKCTLEAPPLPWWWVLTRRSQVSRPPIRFVPQH